MSALALGLVLLAALTHASWNLSAKYAAESRHFVWLFSAGSVLVYAVSHVAPARELSTLVGAWFGSRMLREESGAWRIAGAALIVAGVVSLAWG